MQKSKIYESELLHIIIAVVVLALVIGFQYILDKSWGMFSTAFLFAFIIIGLNIITKKITARALDSDVEHKIWSFSRYGIKAHEKMSSEFPGGILVPLVFSFLTLGYFKIMTILTYEARALKHRAARRFGYYSFTEMTDWHNALIGASGILILLALSIFSYFLPFGNPEILSKMSAYYAFFNLLPLPNLDGMQIYFGSRVLYTVLALITAILTLYAFLLV